MIHSQAQGAVEDYEHSNSYQNGILGIHFGRNLKDLIYTTQCVEIFLNIIASPFNEALAEGMSMLQRFRIYFA